MLVRITEGNDPPAENNGGLAEGPLTFNADIMENLLMERIDALLEAEAVWAKKRKKIE